MRRYLAITICSVLFGCSNEFVLTQKNPPRIEIINDLKTIPADGKSFVEVSLKFDGKLSMNDILKITTSNGSIFDLPSDNFAKGVSNLEKKPNSKDFKFVLMSSRKPDENVVIGVKLNELYSSKMLEFTRVCPEEVLFDLSMIEIYKLNTSQPTATITLLNSKFEVSDSTRVDIFISNDTLASVSPRIIYRDKPAVVNINSLKKLGTLELYATVKQSTCPEVFSKIKKIKFVD